MKIIAKTIVNFAKELDIKTIAEYVHSVEVLNCVKEIGIDYAQGFYIGKPHPSLQTPYTAFSQTSTDIYQLL